MFKMFLTYCYISWAAKILIVGHMWLIGHKFDMLAPDPVPSLLPSSPLMPIACPS